MIKKTYLFTAILIMIVLAGVVTGTFFYFNYQSTGQVACTEEAKLCPDGSYVGRTGPKCEFTKCPDVMTKSTIRGQVNVGPICPVEQVGVPCPVPPEAYTSREIILYTADGVTIVERMHFFADGTYSFQVPPGTYVLNIPPQGIGSTSELPKTFTVKPGDIINFNFSIDTGIR